MAYDGHGIVFWSLLFAIALNRRHHIGSSSSLWRLCDDWDRFDVARCQQLLLLRCGLEFEHKLLSLSSLLFHFVFSYDLDLSLSLQLGFELSCALSIRHILLLQLHLLLHFKYLLLLSFPLQL